MGFFMFWMCMLIHPIYGIVLACKKRYIAGAFRIVVPFLSVYYLFASSMGYHPEESSAEIFRQSMASGNYMPYAALLCSAIWIILILIDVRTLLSYARRKMDAKKAR